MKKEKTRNSQTMTEAAFWGMIRSALRRRSMYWKPIQDAKMAARRESQSENKRQKWEYQCNSCKSWWNAKEIEVDHEMEAGSLRCSDDVGPFIERLFAETGYQVLCKSCHLNKTKSRS